MCQITMNCYEFFKDITSEDIPLVNSLYLKPVRMMNWLKIGSFKWFLSQFAISIIKITIIANWIIIKCFLTFKLFTWLEISALKLVSGIFYQIFIFSPNYSPLKTEKCFLFHLKSSFRSWDIQIFVIFLLPFHTFRIQKGKWKLNNLWCHEMTYINLQM